MTGNKSYLSDYEEIDDGFVVFGGNPKRGKITGKGRIRTGKLDFEDAYFVKELKFNLFSISQMCDKKNSVLFTDTECVVLSHDFKLLDESQVLLRVSRKNNMYSVDLKNIVPSGGTKENIGAGQIGKKTVPDQEYILLPLWTSDPSLSKGPKNTEDYAGKKVTEVPETESRVSSKEDDKDDQDLRNEFKSLNGENDSYGCAMIHNMPNMEEIVYSDDDEDVGTEADMTNLDTHIPVSLILTTRIHKDHPVKQIIRDIHSTPQTRRMTKLVTNHASRPDIMFAVCACARFQVTPKDSPFDLEAYTNSDYAGASLDRKSTTGGCQFLGSRLISWQYKKQTIVANSTTKAEYVAASSCLGQVLWIQNQLLGYGYNFMNTKIFIDNESTICIVKNPVFHSKTKNIEISHHFIRDSYEKRLIQVIKIHTNHKVADLLTNAFDVSRFQYLIANETVIKEWEDIMERAVTTTSSLEVEQDSEKPEESNGFEGIIDFLNASSIKYALTLNPTIYTTCIEQFWATAKAKTINGERQIQAVTPLNRVTAEYGLGVLRHYILSTSQGNTLREIGKSLVKTLLELVRKISHALVDKKKVIITETSVRSDLMLEDAEGTECLPNDVIFEQLTLMGAKTTTWNEFSSTMASAIICLATNQKFNFSKYIFDNMVKNLERGVKFLMYPRSGKGSSGKVTPLFQTMMVQALEDMVKKETEEGQWSTKPIPDVAINEEHVSTPSCDAPQSGEDRMQLNELMSLCTKLSDRVLALENANTYQAAEVATFKERIKKLEKKRRSRIYKPKRLYRVGSSRRVESSEGSLGAQEDASKQGRKIADLDVDEEVTLVDETQGRNDEDLMFDTDVLNGDGVFEEPIVNAAKITSSIPISAADPVTTAGEVVTTASATTTVDELTLAQTLIEIKVAKPKAVITDATTITTAAASTRPKAKEIVFHDQEEQVLASSQTVSPAQPSSKDKGKDKMVEPEPEKKTGRKTQIQLDEELALRMHVEEQAELERMQRERVAQEEASRAAIIEELDSIKAMIKADEQLAARLQAEEQE
ncbi:hypothetical protein Tco_1173876 [Tanacetum coccineum]